MSNSFICSGSVNHCLFPGNAVDACAIVSLQQAQSSIDEPVFANRFLGFGDREQDVSIVPIARIILSDYRCLLLCGKRAVATHAFGFLLFISRTGGEERFIRALRRRQREHVKLLRPGREMRGLFLGSKRVI